MYVSLTNVDNDVEEVVEMALSMPIDEGNEGNIYFLHLLIVILLCESRFAIYDIYSVH